MGNNYIIHERHIKSRGFEIREPSLFKGTLIANPSAFKMGIPVEYSDGSFAGLMSLNLGVVWAVSEESLLPTTEEERTKEMLGGSHFVS